MSPCAPASIELGIDKGQASRLVTRLLTSGLLERHDDPADQRSFFLLLSPAGRRLHDRVAVAAAARNEEWLQGLPAAQRALFVECLDQLSRHTQRMLHEESARSASPQPPLPLRERGEGAAVPERPVIVQPQALRDLQRQQRAYISLEPMRREELSILPDIRTRPDALFVSDGTSCRYQTSDGAQRQDLHVARVLALL